MEDREPLGAVHYPGRQPTDVREAGSVFFGSVFHTAQLGHPGPDHHPFQHLLSPLPLLDPQLLPLSALFDRSFVLHVPDQADLVVSASGDGLPLLREIHDPSAVFLCQG